MTAQQNILVMLSIDGSIDIAHNSSPAFLNRTFPYFTSQDILAQADDPQFLPIIKRISAIRRDCTEALPRVAPIQIELDNRSGSLDPSRKFTDFLAGQSIINQPCSVLIFEALASGLFPDLTNFANSKRRFNGIIRDITSNTDTESVLINIDIYTPNTQPLTYKISSSTSATGLAANKILSNAYGQALPMIIGRDVFVKLLQITDGATKWNTNSDSAFGSGSEEAYYGLCSGRVGHSPSAPSEIYIKDEINKYRKFVPTTTPTTVDAQYTQNPGYVNYTDLANGSELGDYIKFPNTAYTNARVLTGGIIKLRGNTAYTGTVGGTVTVQIYRVDPTVSYDATGNRPDKEPIAKAVIEKDLYAAQFVVNANFDIYFQLDKPVWVDNSQTSQLFFSITHDDNSTAASNQLRVPHGTGSSFKKFRRREAGKNWRKYTTTNLLYQSWYILGGAMHPHLFANDLNGNEGYTYAIAAASLISYNAISCDLSKLDLIVKTNGVLDNSSGTYTGVSNQLIEDVPEILHFLSAKYSGSFLGGFNADFSQSFFSDDNVVVYNSSNQYYRKLSFAITGDAKADNIISEVCRQSMTNIALVSSPGSSTSLGCRAFGNSEPVVQIFTDDDLLSSRYDFKDSKSIINSVEIIYKPDLLEYGTEDLLKRGYERGFAGYYTKTGSYTSNLEFGVRPLNNTKFTYINDATSAEHMADLYILKNQFPYEYFEIEVPITMTWDLQLYSMIQVMTPKFPSYFGAEIRPRLPTYNNADSEIAGIDEARGTYIYGFIETIDDQLNFQGVSVCKLICRVIRFPDPTLPN